MGPQAGDVLPCKLIDQHASTTARQTHKADSPAQHARRRHGTARAACPACQGGLEAAGGFCGRPGSRGGAGMAAAAAAGSHLPVVCRGALQPKLRWTLGAWSTAQGMQQPSPMHPMQLIPSQAPTSSSDESAVHGRKVLVRTGTLQQMYCSKCRSAGESNSAACWVTL
ncbi:hypothetical protein HaLaN_02185 [Haematococcus lacustris]|uniref:Uncharacterized protein n=1 Tax=Haematococcus lacustris TaxID=44745 RepID=A0A699YBF4_HAELA|nr:hypothetical protein HaLaN_02185 [Haematococcus lacustris]